MALQSAKSPNFGNLRISNLGVLKQNDFGCSPMPNHRKYYKGEGGAFSIYAMVSLVSPCVFITCPCTKSATNMHEPTCCLVCVGLCE